jgi:hypothetical protein
MREIKFRAWDTILNCYYKSSIDLKVNTSGIYTPELGNRFIFEQYTGLKDSNGKEIYEGDIVEFTWWWFDGTERESILTGTIVYDGHLMS